MFCSHCGTPLPENANVCPNCGNFVNRGNQSAAPVINNITVYNQVRVSRLNTSRGLLKYILLSIITIGIYPLIFYSDISTDINTIASRYDGKKTMHFCLLFFIVGPITLGIAYIVWFHNVSSRIGYELKRRGILYSFGAADFWIWDILGALILVGPFIYLHNLCKAMNKLSEDFNVNG